MLRTVPARGARTAPYPDVLGVLAPPDFSHIPPDPDIAVPDRLRLDPLRLARITYVFAKHGVFLSTKWLRGHARGPAFARHLREAFEALGPTFIKLGQMIASSPGIFPPAISDEFVKCLDKVPPFPFSEVERILAEDFGPDWRGRFRSIDPEPVAAASIAQVHFAALADGTPVVIKIQRPGIRRIIDRDLGILFVLAKSLVALFDNAHLANPVGVISDFNHTLHEELDFRLEANHMERFNAVFAGEATLPIYAARVHRELVTERVLVMERLTGARVDDLDAVLATGVNPTHALALGVKAFMRTLMLHGFFHGDVHAGNLFVSDGPRIHFMDFGITGRLTPEQMQGVTNFLAYLTTGRMRELAHVLVDMGSAPPDVDVDGLARDVGAIAGEFDGKPIGDIDLGEMLQGIIAAAVTHKVRLPREFILLIKQLIYFDRYAHIVAPDFDIFGEPFLLDFIWRDPAGKTTYPHLQFLALV